MKAITVFGGFGLLLSLGAAGCGGVTEQPLGDVAGSSSTGGTSDHQSAGSGGSGNGSPAPHGCEDPCLQKILTGSAASCKLCHTAKTTDMGGLQSSGLDLESPNVTARLKDVTAKHLDISPGMPTMCPTGDFLVDTANPHNSWLLRKIKGQQGTCGTQMPQPPTSLRGDEVACIESYVYCVAGQTPP
jgi:hypothetical protein